MVGIAMEIVDLNDCYFSFLYKFEILAIAIIEDEYEDKNKKKEARPSKD